MSGHTSLFARDDFGFLEGKESMLLKLMKGRGAIGPNSPAVSHFSSPYDGFLKSPLVG